MRERGCFDDCSRWFRASHWLQLFASLRCCSPACIKAMSSSVQFYFFLGNERQFFSGMSECDFILQCSVPIVHRIFVFWDPVKTFPYWFRDRSNKNLVRHPNLQGAPSHVSSYLTRYGIRTVLGYFFPECYKK